MKVDYFSAEEISKSSGIDSLKIRRWMLKGFLERCPARKKYRRFNLIRLHIISELKRLGWSLLSIEKSKVLDHITIDHEDRILLIKKEPRKKRLHNMKFLIGEFEFCIGTLEHDLIYLDILFECDKYLIMKEG